MRLEKRLDAHVTKESDPMFVNVLFEEGFTSIRHSYF